MADVIPQNIEMFPTSVQSPLSHDDSQDTYKEKFENLKILVQQQQRELQSQKIRNEGVETITTCLQEEREENIQLRNKILKMEQTVTTLQSRLSVSGHSPNGSLQDGETVLPGPSKQLMDNLVRENTRLRQSLRQASGDPAQMEHLEKTIHTQQEQIEFLRQENTRLSEELQKFKMEAVTSPTDKDSEILRLKKEMIHLQKSKDTQDVLCQSLSEESVMLRQRLKETADMCQHLAHKIDNNKSNKQQRPAAVVDESLQRMSLSSQGSDNSLNEECATLRVHKSRLENEIVRVQNQLKAAETANAKWQVYDAQRNEHYQTLQRRLAEMESRVAASAGTVSLSEQQQMDIDRLLMQSKSKVEEAEHEKVKIEDENRSLRLRNKELEDNIEAVQEQLTHLRAMTPTSTGSQRPEDRDHIRMLEAQVQIFTEDFEHERKDRERAQSKCSELESELDLIKRQLEQFQATHMNRLYNQRAAALSNYQNEYYNHRNIYAMVPQHQPSPRLIARGGMGVYEADGDGDDEGEDCLDSGDIPPVAMAVRDSVAPSVIRSSGSTAAHGSITTDSNVTSPPPAFLPKNAKSSHPEGSLFRESSMNNNPPQPATPGLLNNVSRRTTSRFANQQELGRGDVLSDSVRVDNMDDTLQCPRCRKEYPTQNHVDFLEHVDKCIA